MLWQFLHSGAEELVGYIPTFLSERDPRPAREQFNERYAHGGGWHKFEGFTMDRSTGTIRYPDDPPYHPIAMTHLHKELILVYNHAWVAIVQEDGTYEIARLD